MQANRDFRVEKISYVNDTGLAENATNFFNIEAKNGSAVVADWSTETGEDGTIAAATFVILNLVEAERVLSAGDTLTILFTEDGTTTLPPGKFQIEGHYL
jgi:hypothetical protein